MGAREGSELQGKRIAVLMTDGVEQVEYTKPRQFLEQHGAKVTLVAPKSKGEQVQGFNHLTPADKFTVELDVKDARPGDVVVDGKLVTSRKPDDIPKFDEAMMRLLH